MSKQAPFNDPDLGDAVPPGVAPPSFDTPVFDRAAPGKRSVAVIQAEYEAIRRRFVELRKLNDQQWEHRQSILGTHAIAKMQWDQSPVTKGQPFNAAAYPGLVPVPPEDTTASRDLHKIQYALGLLTKELQEAKLALV